MYLSLNNQTIVQNRGGSWAATIQPSPKSGQGQSSIRLHLEGLLTFWAGRTSYDFMTNYIL